jgi:CRP/FNR family nitrogen fixation transcriptional regulator
MSATVLHTPNGGPARRSFEAIRPRTADGAPSLQALGAVQRFTRNETIFNEGDEARFSYKVVSGAVRLCKVLPDGRRQIADFSLPGDFFGLEAGDEHALTAEALCDVVLVRYAKAQLDQLSDDRADIRDQLLMTLRQSLWSAQHHVIMLGRQTAMERVVSFLLQLGARAGTRSGGAVELPMGRQDIADYLGLTIETVCRALSELKSRKLITTPDRRTVVLKNIPALEALRETDN